jgi:hypothetical protein
VKILEPYPKQKFLGTHAEFYKVKVNDYVVFHYHDGDDDDDEDSKQHSVSICKVEKIETSNSLGYMIYQIKLELFWEYNNAAVESKWKEQINSKAKFSIKVALDADVVEVHIPQNNEPVVEHKNKITYYKLPIEKGFEHLFESNNPSTLYEINDIIVSKFKYDIYRNIMSFV